MRIFPIFLGPLIIASPASGQSPSDPMQSPPAHVESTLEAIEEDASAYAARYGVSLAEAIGRIEAQQESVAATDRLQRAYRDRLAGMWLEHVPQFRLVVLLTGDDPVPDEVIHAGGLAIAVTFRTGAPATREQILAAIASHQADLRAALSAPPGMGVDPRRGVLVVMVRAADLDQDGEAALTERLSAIAGVPVEIRAWDRADVDMDAEGGGRVMGVEPGDGRRYVCTGGFVVTDGVRTALTTAAHCPDALNYVAPDKSRLPLTLLGAWGAGYQDVQIHDAGTPLSPHFYADSDKTRLRRVTSWRNRTSTRAGDFVCHRGERTGYNCAEVEFVDYAPPGDLCAGPCPATWVAVKGPGCRSGDSGGPVFSGTIAFGLVKGGSYDAGGRCHLYYYMSTDYLPPGWQLLHE